MPVSRHGRYFLVPSEGREIHGLEVEEVVLDLQTSYQNLVIARTSGFGHALYLDGDFMSCEGDEHLYHEALVLPALLAQPAPRRALVLGGGEGATARELLRDPGLESVRMVELDREVIEACKKHLPSMSAGAFEDPRLEVCVQDALEVVRDERNADLIVHDLTDPLEGGPSCPLFTEEFFQDCRRAMSPRGVLVVQVGAMKLWREQTQLDALDAMRAVFPWVFPYAVGVPSFGCDWVLTMASMHEPAFPREPRAVDAMIEQRGIRGLRTYDGLTHTGLMHPPGHLRWLLATPQERTKEATAR